MDPERKILEKVRKYLIGLGYPPEVIFYQYMTEFNRHSDVVIKSNDKILVVIELKSKLKLNLDVIEEIGFHPLARILQKEAKELGAKYYMLSNGEKHVWLQTAEGGRPEPINDVPYARFKEM